MGCFLPSGGKRPIWIIPLIRSHVEFGNRPKRWMLAVAATAMVGGVAGVWVGGRVISAPAQGTYQPGWANVAYAGETGPIGQKLVSLAQQSAIIYHLDNSTGGWTKYVPGRPELSDLTTATKGEAYLALLTQPLSIDLASCPAATPAPQCPTSTPENVMDEWCSWERASLEVWRIVLDVNIALGIDPSGARDAISDGEAFISQRCQGLGFDVIPSSGMSQTCWFAGGWEGRYSSTLIDLDLLPGEEQALREAVNRLNTLANKYCR